MIQIGDFIFSLDVLEKKFRCDLEACHGNCCLEGDSGAPLSNDESVILLDIYSDIRDYLREEGRRAIEEQGTSIIDSDGDIVTPLIAGRECAYAVYDNATWFCGIERAWADGKTDFQKPVSCHLFPIRVKKFSDITAVNYQEIDICEPARDYGEKEGLAVYKFLKEAIIRAFGSDIYNELSKAGEELLSGKSSSKSLK